MRTGISGLSIALLLAVTNICVGQNDPEDIPPPLPVPDSSVSYERSPTNYPAEEGGGDGEIRAFDFGASVVPSPDGVQVVGVIVDSPAANAGVKPGDIISRVNDAEASANALMGNVETVEVTRQGLRQTLGVRMQAGSATYTNPTPTMSDPTYSEYERERVPYEDSDQFEAREIPAQQPQSRVHSYSVPRTTYSAPQRYYVTPRYQSQRYYEPPSAYRTRYYSYRPSAAVYFRPSPNVTIGIGNGVGLYGYPGYPGVGYYGRGFGYGPGYGLGPGRGRGGVGISIGGVGIRF